MALTLRDIVFQALGEVSMCWKPQPSGTFDDEYAVIVGNALIEAIEEYTGSTEEKSPSKWELPQEFPETVTVELDYDGKRYKGSIPCIEPIGGDSNAH